MAGRSGDQRLTKFVDRHTVPRIDEKDVTLVSYLEWWDGPLNGLVEYGGATHWFEFCGDCDQCTFQLDPDNDCTHDSGRHYYYLVYPLTAEQQVAAHAAIAARREAGDTGPDLSATPPLGWFMDGANNAFYGIDIVPAQGGK